MRSQNSPVLLALVSRLEPSWGTAKSVLYQYIVSGLHAGVPRYYLSFRTQRQIHGPTVSRDSSMDTKDLGSWIWKSGLPTVHPVATTWLHLTSFPLLPPTIQQS